MSQDKFPPRGYVDRDRWMWINDRCDPGDAARDCPVHFIPHNKFQLPSMVQMMSVAEHDHLTSKLVEALENIKNGMLPNGDHANLPAMEYAEKALEAHRGKE